MARLLENRPVELEKPPAWNTDAIRGVFNRSLKSKNETEADHACFLRGAGRVPAALPAFDAMALLGRDLTLRRLHYALETLETQGIAPGGKQLKDLEKLTALAYGAPRIVSAGAIKRPSNTEPLKETPFTMTTDTDTASHFIKDIIAADLRANKYGAWVVTRFLPEPNGASAHRPCQVHSYTSAWRRNSADAATCGLTTPIPPPRTWNTWTPSRRTSAAGIRLGGTPAFRLRLLPAPV